MRRMSIAISDELYERLEKRGKDEEKTLIDVIREDLGYGEWVTGVVRDKKRELLIKEGNTTSRVVIPGSDG